LAGFAAGLRRYRLRRIRTIAAFGFALLALSGPTTPYWIGFLLPIAVVGPGMAITVAPLTTTVINAVPRHQTGVAFGNAVASVATLLAIFGAVALSGFNRTLNQHLQNPTLSSGVRKALERAHGKFVEPSLTSGPGEDRLIAEATVREALSDGIRIAILLAATLSLAGAGYAGVHNLPR
jgi:hypothetical protein